MVHFTGNRRTLRFATSTKKIVIFGYSNLRTFNLKSKLFITFHTFSLFVVDFPKENNFVILKKGLH